VIVADTCVVIWLATAPAELSKRAIEAITTARSEGGIAISSITLYELAWLATRKRINVGSALGAFLAHVEANFIVLPVTAAIAQAAAELPTGYPSDPGDRLIGATALNYGLSLITPDAAIRKSKALPIIW
jgi:PIN domain nuclease of toxin-antitoxin system